MMRRVSRTIQSAVLCKFTGKERDSESGLDDLGLRYMSSNMGRFMSPDSIANDWELVNPQTWNRYAYARNNPLIYVDPHGAEPQPIGDSKRLMELVDLFMALGQKEDASLHIREAKDAEAQNQNAGTPAPTNPDRTPKPPPNPPPPGADAGNHRPIRLGTAIRL